MKKVILSVTNDLSYDHRIHRIASTLSKNGFETTVIGRKLPNSSSLAKYSYTTERMSILFNKGALFYLFYNIQLFFKLIFRNVDILIANDTDTLLANYLAFKLKRCELIFDSHELFSEVPEIQNKPFVKGVWKRIEKAVIPKLKMNYTVSQSIARYYNEKYQAPFEVIRNLPFKRGTIKPKEIYLPKEKSILIYQGSVNKGRGIEDVLNCLKYIPQVHFLIVGDGDILSNIKEQVKKLNLLTQVTIVGGVPFNEVARYTQLATLGMSLEQDMGLNYKYALPNKIFDYLQSQIPVIVRGLPEMKTFIEKCKVGKTVPIYCEPKELAKIISDTIENKDAYKEDILHFSKILVWEEEEKKYLQMLKKWNVLNE